jgi:hypothetical protein
LPGLHAQVSLYEVLQGNLSKAFSYRPEFDLCICNLRASELGQFADVVKAVKPCMRSGGKVIGFYPNFELAPVLTDHVALLQDLLEVSRSGRLLYAGSEKSAHVVRRFHQALSGGGKSRLAGVARLATMLFLVAPSALAANRLEAATRDEQASRLPEHCTSVTIDATV